MNNNRRIVVEIPEHLHRQMRVSAAVKNLTLKDWLMNAMITYLKYEKELNNEIES